ncbi:hypothetical protein ACJD0Z_18690 [Flavobacteriaceae bacterium M23B6Z8]
MSSKYEELNAMIVNIKQQLKEGAISIEEAKRLLELVYEEYQNLEAEERNTEINEMTKVFISKWLHLE